MNVLNTCSKYIPVEVYDIPPKTIFNKASCTRTKLHLLYQQCALAIRMH